MIGLPRALLGLVRSHNGLAAGATTAAGVAAGIALAPATLVFACTCNCPGGPPPVVPEAPWAPLVLIAGGVAALIAWRARRGGPPGSRGFGAGFRLRFAGRRKVSGGLVAKIACAGMIAIAGLGALSAAGATRTSAATNAGCSTPTPSPTSGTQGIVSVPDAGAAAALDPLAVSRI